MRPRFQIRPLGVWGRPYTEPEAARVLADAAGVRPESLARPDGVTYAFRLAAKTTHPDAGGNADVFRLVSKARDILLNGRTTPA